MAKTAVVILNFNGRDFLLRFLPILIQNTPEAEIVVADNASTDDSLQVITEFPSVRTIALKTNYGYAGGYNEALKEIDSEYFVLLNSDVEVPEGWLEPLETYLDNHPSCAAVQPKLLDFHKREYFEYAGGAGGFLDSLGYPYCRGRIFETLEADTGQYDSEADIFWCSGACFMVRSETFWQVGAFDPDFFAHMEEIDFCWRLRSHGYGITCVPASKVYHVGGGTLNKSQPRKTYLNFRNNLALLTKNLPLSHLLMILPVRFLLDLIAGLKFMIQQSPDHFMAVLRAQKDLLFKFRNHYGKRGPTSPIHSASEKKIFLVMDYFVRGKKTFHSVNNTK